MFEFFKLNFCFGDKKPEQKPPDDQGYMLETCPDCGKIFKAKKRKYHLEEECFQAGAKLKISKAKPVNSVAKVNGRKEHSRMINGYKGGVFATNGDSFLVNAICAFDNIINLQEEYDDYRGQTFDELIQRVKALRREDRVNFEKKFIERYYGRDFEDSYAIDKCWLRVYMEYLTDAPENVIGPIDNWKHFAYLKTRERPDYYAFINDVVWRFLIEMYSGGPCVLIRDGEVIIDPERNSNDVTADSTSTNTSTVKSHKLGSEPDSASSLAKKYMAKPIGLSNERYFCYLNSVLQCLANFSAFCNSLDETNNLGLVSDGKWTRAMLEFVEAQNKSGRPYDAKAVKKLAKTTFRDDQQHDSHEFMRHLLSKIQDEINKKNADDKPQKAMNFADAQSAWDFYKQNHYSCVDEIFAGQIESQVFCKTCHEISTTYDPVLDLSLSLISNVDTLKGCVDKFFIEEELPDTYLCEKCNQTTKAIRKTRMSKLPKVLVLHLKRFKMYPTKTKISDQIAFPFEGFTISKTTDSQPEGTYSLKGVVVHRGTSSNSGHYISYVKRQDDWYLCDDESVKKVTSKEVGQKEAYILFYQLNE